MALWAGCATLDDVRRSGLPAQGTLVAAHETGWRINGSPLIDLDMRIEAAQRAPWEARLRETLALTDLYRLAPGSVFPLRYDPAKPWRVVIDRGGDRGVSDSAATQQLDQCAALNKALRTTGLLARAQVTRYTQLAMVNGRYPFVELAVDVTPDGAPPFNGVVCGAIAPESVAKFQVGRSVYVHYDPQDLRRVGLSGSDKPDTTQTVPATP